MKGREEKREKGTKAKNGEKEKGRERVGKWMGRRERGREEGKKGKREEKRGEGGRVGETEGERCGWV